MRKENNNNQHATILCPNPAVLGNALSAADPISPQAITTTSPQQQPSSSSNSFGTPISSTWKLRVTVFRQHGAMGPRWAVFLLTYSVYSVVYITRKCFSVVKTLMRDDLGLDAYSLGAIDSAFLGTYAAFQIYLPSLSDRWGVRPVLVVTLLGAGLFSALFSIGHSAHGLLACWLLQGICHAPIFAVLVKAVSLWYPQAERVKMLGLWTTSQQVGGMISTILATFVGARWGWRAVFLLAAVVTAGFGVLVAIALPEPPVTEMDAKQSPEVFLGEPRGDNEHNNASSVELQAIVVKRKKAEATTEQQPSTTLAVPPLSSLPVFPTAETTTSASGTPVTNGGAAANVLPPAPASFLQVMLLPGILPCAFAYMCVKLVRYALLFWLPFFLSSELGFGASLAGYSSMAFDLGGILGSVCSGFLADKCFKGRRFVATAALCVAAAVSLFAFAAVSEVENFTHRLNNRGPGAVRWPPNFVPVVLLMALVGFFVAGPDSMLGAASAGEVLQRRPGMESSLSTATGIVNGLGAFGGLLQGYVTAYVSSELGWPALFCILACAALGSVICLTKLIAYDVRGDPDGGRYARVTLPCGD